MKRALNRVVVGLTLTVAITGVATAPAFGSVDDPTNSGTGGSNDRGSTVSHCHGGVSVTTPKAKNPTTTCKPAETPPTVIRISNGAF
jgi:hypothetical protein